MSLRTTDVRTPGAAAIAKKWGLPLTKVYGLISQGAKVEFEHNRDKAKAKQIARDHINERPDYYKRLKSMERLPIRMKEGLSTEPERDSETIGDYTGASRKVMKVDETNKINLEKKKNIIQMMGNIGDKSVSRTKAIRAGRAALKKPVFFDPPKKEQISEINIKKITDKIPPQVKKIGRNAVVAANLATLGQVAGDAAEGRKGADPKRGMLAAVSTLPGPVGYGAMGVNWTVKGYDKAREHLRANIGKKMEEQGSPANPARYTERPMYEGDAMKDAENKIKAAFTADKVKDMFKRVDKQRDKDPKWVAYKKRKQMKEEVSDAQVDRYLKGIGGTESGGTKDPYTARSKRSSASGKYQFIDSTWRNVVRKYGSPGDVKKYPHASSAPPDYQEKVARSNAKGEIERYGERGAVLTHFTGNPAGKMGRAAQRANPGVTADTYYKRFQKFAGDVIGTKSASASDKPATSTAPKPEITNKSPETPKTPEVAKTPETTSKNFGVSFASNDVAKKMSAPQTPDTSSNNYTVRRGDTLSDIAKSHHTDVNTIAKASHISDPNKIYPGQKIKFDEDRINELSAELVGKVSNARFWRKEAPSETLSRAINKKFVESGKKKEEPKKPLKEETKMDTKDLINEALDDILENNLVSMKENLMTALQEKAMEKIEEKKKDIAANYFAQ